MITGKEKACGAMAYISWLLLLIAALICPKEERSEFVRHHLNQGFILNAYGTLVLGLQRIPQLEKVGVALSFVILVLLIWGIVNAVRGSSDDIPLLNVGEVFK